MFGGVFVDVYSFVKASLLSPYYCQKQHFSSYKDRVPPLLMLN